MPVTIEIRDVPERVRDILTEVARNRGQSLSTYLRDLLEDHSRHVHTSP